MQKTEQETIEYETVTLKIPKKVMKLLRDTDYLGETAEQYIERGIVDLVRADIDMGECFTPTPRQLTEQYGLDPIFKEITGSTVSG
jgi:hypothetical protein